MTAKIENYSAEQTATLVAAYKANPSQETVATLATQMGKTVRSVIAKLAKEQVYMAPAKTVAKREMLKKDMVAEMAVELGVNEEVLESLEKATGPALMLVLKALKA